MATYPTNIGTLTHDRLRAGCVKREVVRTGNINQVALAAALARGTVLGRVAGAITGAAVAGNTGTGVLSALSVGRRVCDGEVYRIVLRTAGATGAFDVLAPDGTLVGQGAVGTAFVSDHINFSLADGTPDFIAGDAFNVTVAKGTVYRPVNTANTDGSATVRGILLEDVPLVAADTTFPVAIAFEGEFNEAALVFGGSDTIATHREALVRIGCQLRTSQNVDGLG